MLVLNENEQCPHASKCKYNPDGQCYGGIPNRVHRFTCEYATRTEVLSGGQIRNINDKTGKMQVIMEQT